MGMIQKIWRKISGKQQEEVLPVVEEERSLKSIIAGFCEAGVEHVSSLAALFYVELQESIQRVRSKIVCLLFGLFFIVMTYLLGCAVITVLLCEWMDLLMALLCVFGFNALTGMIFLVVASKKHFGPIAPETRKELKSDYECLQLAIKESKNS